MTDATLPLNSPGKLDGRFCRYLVLAVLTLAITLAHWLTPVAGGAGHLFHVFHLVLRELYLLPVFLGAIWFELPGAILTSAAVSLAFLPFTAYSWFHAPNEAVNQWGELAGLWIVALVSGALVRREKSALVRLSRMFEGTVEALVGALDVRERGTADHSRRVRTLSLWLARKLNLSRPVMEDLRHGALLHDIGKLGVPDSILLKEGALSPEEREIMNQHPVLGKRIVSSVPELGGAVHVIEFHHERWDGSGYPQGLKAEAIPLEARVFAVADVLDALTSKRPYRKSAAFMEASNWIQSQSETHFDPAVVAALKMMNTDEWNRFRKEAG